MYLSEQEDHDATCVPTAPTLNGAMPSPPRPLPPSSSRQPSRPLQTMRRTCQLFDNTRCQVMNNMNC